MVGIDLPRGGTLFIYLTFFFVLIIYLLKKEERFLKINQLDKLYIFYCAIWLVLYLINFDYELFQTNKVYKQAPVFLAFTFLLPVILKPTYSNKVVEKIIYHLELLGLGSALVLFILLILGFPSREAWIEADDIIFRYSPIRGYFSNRQAILIAIGIIIFVSRVSYGMVKRKEYYWKIPLVMLGFGGIIVSGSRGILFICIMISVYLFFTVMKFQKKIIAVITLVILMIGLTSFFKIEKYKTWTTRIFSTESYSGEKTGFSVRFVRYKTGLDNFLESPILGNGMSKMTPDYDYSHNIFISILEDTGVVGFFWLSAFMIFLLFHFKWRKINELNSPNALITRNMIVFFFLTTNLYGSIIAHKAIFLLLSIYYFNYCQNHSKFLGPNKI